MEAGLAIAEMIASLSKPTVSLVLGGSHSIGVPIAVITDYSYIVPTGTMVIHPVRMNGMVIGVPQTFDYFKQIQDRITWLLYTSPTLPLPLVNALRTLAAVRFWLSVSASTMMAIPFGPYPSYVTYL